jgi:hypothetical protein
VDLPRGAADKGRDGSDGQGNGRCSETLREREQAFSQALLSKLVMLEAEIADGQCAAAGLAARVDERHRCRVAGWTDCPGRHSVAVFPPRGSFHCSLWSIRSEFPEGPRQFPHAIDRDYQRL